MCVYNNIYTRILFYHNIVCPCFVHLCKNNQKYCLPLFVAVNVKVCYSHTLFSPLASSCVAAKSAGSCAACCCSSVVCCGEKRKWR